MRIAPPTNTSEPPETMGSLRRKAARFLSRYSIPLYRYDERRRPVQFGTGFFVQADGAHFLVSAAHVLRESQVREVFFYAAQKTLRRLRGRIRTTGGVEGVTADPLDVAVLRLSGSAIPPFPEVEKFSLNYSDLLAEYLPRSGKRYVVVGFPSTKSGIDPVARRAIVKAYAYDTHSVVVENAYEKHDVAPATHILLPFDRKRSMDADGRAVIFPKPQGMSGSPILVLYEDDGPSVQSRPAFPVVGVAVRSPVGAKIIVGTDIRFVREMILEHLSEPEPAA
jgi:hypothetical protein